MPLGISDRNTIKPDSDKGLVTDGGIAAEIDGKV